MNGNDAEKLLFKTYSKKLTKINRLSKKRIFVKNRRKQEPLSYKMWKTINLFFNKKFADTNSLPNNIKIDGETWDNNLAMAEHFTNVFVQSANDWSEKWKITAFKVQPDT